MFHNGKRGNLCIDLGDYFKLYFIMVEVGILDANLGGYFMYFHRGIGE